MPSSSITDSSLAADADAQARATAHALGFDPHRLARIDSVLNSDVDSAAIPGAVVLILRCGKVAYHRAFGFADRAARRPMQCSSIFRIASMTKPITVVAALQLMEEGKLVLTDPVSRYLAELGNVQVGVEPTAGSGAVELRLEPCVRAMTVHDLMRHTAGFTYGQFGDSSIHRAYRAAHMMDDRQTNADMVGKLARLPLAHQPGTTFEYGMSTDVLGRIVEVVSGRDLGGYIAEFITRPLAMSDTSFGIDPAALDRLAEPQQDAAALDRSVFHPYDPAHPARWQSGGGGLLATAVDYGRFAQMLLNAGELDGIRLLSRKTVDLMLHNHLGPELKYGTKTAELGMAAPLRELGQGYGLGLGVREHPGLSPVPGSVGDFHWGGASGPYFWADPAADLSVIFMLQELNVQRRTRYRALLRSLVYQALR